MKHLFVLLAILLITGTAFGQGFVSGVTTYEAAVSYGLTIAGGALAMGELTQGQCYTFTPDGFKNPVGAGETPGDVIIGDPAFVIEGNPYDYVEVELLTPVWLIGDAGGRFLMTNFVYGYNYDGAGVDAGFIGQAPVSGPFIVDIGTASVDIYLGFRTCVPVGAMAGTYTGQLIAEAHYIVQP
ncbi:MAG: hypothetical protein QME52_11480 [Bacteroidota bacterium]|nr:hypothetical protein [Bacteroidota bacterium]